MKPKDDPIKVKWALLIGLGVVFVLFVFPVSGMVSNLTSPTPYPLDYPPVKQTIEWREEMTRQVAFLTPAPPPGSKIIPPAPTRPPKSLPSGTPAGVGVITINVGMPPMPIRRMYSLDSLAWVESFGNTDLIVYAGALNNDSTQGMVYVVRSDSIDFPAGSEYLTSTKRGALRITGARSERLILLSNDGTEFYFDVPGRTFVNSLAQVVPTAVPLPTRTLVPTFTPNMSDDVPDQPGFVYQYSLPDTNLRYFINPAGDVDWFRFHLDRSGTAEVLLTDLPADYDVMIYAATYPQIFGISTNRGQVSEKIVLTNAPVDDYYVKVVGVNGASNATKPYQLRFNALCTIPDLSNLVDDIYKQSGKSQNVIEKLKEAQKELDKGKTDKAAEKIWEAIKEVDKDAGKQDDKDDDKEKEKKRIALSLITTFKDSAFCVLGKLGKDETNLKAMESLRALVAKDYQQQLITSDEARDQLDKRLTEAQEKLVKEGAKKAVDELNKFITDVRKERDKKIAALAADELTTKAQAIVDQLK